MKKMFKIICLALTFCLFSFNSHASNIYDLIGKSYKGCEIIDVIFEENPNQHYLITCIKQNDNKEYEMLRYTINYSYYYITDEIEIKDIVNLLK